MYNNFSSSVYLYKNIFDDFIHETYSLIYSIVNNHEVSFKIMNAVFESVFIIDNHKLLEKAIKVEVFNKAVLLSNQYLKENQILNNKDEEFYFPKELELFSFNSSIYYTDRMNIIVVLRIVYDVSFADIARYVNIPTQQVIKEFLSVIGRMKCEYKERVKKSIRIAS